MISLALYEPEIPQNTGTLMRLCACFDISLHIIEPCGFLWNNRKLSRSVMDYLDICTIEKHLSYDHFIDYADKNQKRIVLIDVDGNQNCWNFTFSPDDILLMGKESTGVTASIKEKTKQSVHIPQKKGRSLNMAIAASIVVSEAIRQTKG